jgi:copper chaperone
MQTVTYTIPNINCNHCVHTIKMEIGEIPGVSSVDGSPDSKKVIINFEPPATEEKIKSVLQDINYPPQE